jgi:hypothetical protein
LSWSQHRLIEQNAGRADTGQLLFFLHAIRYVASLRLGGNASGTNHDQRQDENRSV